MLPVAKASTCSTHRQSLRHWLTNVSPRRRPLPTSVVQFHPGFRSQSSIARDLRCVNRVRVTRIDAWTADTRNQEPTLTLPSNYGYRYLHYYHYALHSVHDYPLSFSARRLFVNVMPAASPLTPVTSHPVYRQSVSCVTRRRPDRGGEDDRAN